MACLNLTIARDPQDAAWLLWWATDFPGAHANGGRPVRRASGRLRALPGTGDVGLAEALRGIADQLVDRASGG